MAKNARFLKGVSLYSDTNIAYFDFKINIFLEKDVG